MKRVRWTLALGLVSVAACRGSVDRVYDDDTVDSITVDGGTDDAADAGPLTVGGTVTNLTGTLVLQNNGTNSFAISKSGAWAFPDPVTSGSSYAVTVLTQPVGETCTVSNGTGTVGTSSVSNVDIACVANHKLGGAISGLTGSGLVLQNKGSDDLAVAAGATSFSFPASVAEGATYAVTVKTEPSGPVQTCQVSSGTGTVGASDVMSVSISCTTNTYAVSANVSGLTGTVVLKNNGGDDISPSTNGIHAFPTSIASGSPYAVTVATQPAKARCLLGDPHSGTITNAPVTVAVTCLDSFYEDFDGPTETIPPAGWTFSTVQGTPASDGWWEYVGRPDTAPNYAYLAPAAHVVDTRLTSPIIAIVNTNAQLHFRNRYDAESGFDGGVLEVSIDGGAFEDILASGATFQTGGYVALISTSYSSPIGGRSAWTGLSGPGGTSAYIDTLVSFPASFAGKNIQLRWRWTSDSSGVSPEGWAVDTIQLDR